MYTFIISSAPFIPSTRLTPSAPSSAPRPRSRPPLIPSQTPARRSPTPSPSRFSDPPPTCMSAAPPRPTSLSHLQNGSDVRGVAAPLDPAQPVTLTDAAVAEIVAAFVRSVSALTAKPTSELRIALGRDSRITGPHLLHAAAAGAAQERAAVTDFQLCTTPAMFMSTVLHPYNFDCACMLTASHLPPNRNGIKFFTNRGSADKHTVKAILASAERAAERRRAPISTVPVPTSTVHFLPVYAQHLAQLIRKGCNHPTNYDRPLTGFNIVVDAGNGAAGFFASTLQTLGAHVVGQFLEPDGMFPNHVPNPEDATAMAMTVETTTRENADLGVIFDTDVDRSGFVDANGVAINRNKLIAVLARIVLREHPGSTIVTDSVTSNGLARFIQNLGGKHFRYRKGYKNVIDKGIELNQAGIPTELAIETSGHGAMRENYMLDDGAYLAVKILIEMVRLRLAGDSRGIGGLLDGLDEPLEEKEFRLKFLDQSDYSNYGANVVEAFAKFASGVNGWKVEETNYEGYRVSVDEGDGKAGWLLLRQSLHDPLLPLNIESEVAGGVAAIAKVLVDDFLPHHSNVDPSALQQYILKN